MHQNSASFSLSINWFLRFAVVFIQIVAVCIFEYTRWIRVYFYFLIVKSVFEFKQSTFYDVILGVTGVTELRGALFSRNYYVHARVCRTIVRTTCSLLSVLHYLVPTLLQSLYSCASCNWLVGIPFESSQSKVLLLQHFARVQSARTAYYWTTIYNTKNLTTLLNVPKSKILL